MADGGGGKIRAKKSLKSRKPYSRPQNQVWIKSYMM